MDPWPREERPSATEGALRCPPLKLGGGGTASGEGAPRKATRARFEQLAEKRSLSAWSRRARPAAICSKVAARSAGDRRRAVAEGASSRGSDHSGAFHESEARADRRRTTQNHL